MFNYEWSLAEGYPAENVEDHKLKVFTTFSCGGGSSMGYKLAGYDVIAANDIDGDMQRVYVANHNPKHYLLASVKELLEKDLPAELYDIDVLDGSPPCSVFSTAGLREDAWQKEKFFREGQERQVLDDLFFDFISLAEKLRPKIIIAENVKGMLLGSAKWYTREIHRRLDKLGYEGKIFLLNGAGMGLPQKRERVFFIYAKKDLNFPKLRMEFNAKPVQYHKIRQDSGTIVEGITDLYREYWKHSSSRKSVGKFMQVRKMGLYDVPNTLTASQLPFDCLQPRKLYLEEILRISSFPKDYNFINIKPNYLMGMSVPPLMMANVSYQVYKQWGSKLYAN